MMRQLSRHETLKMLAGGVMMVLSAGVNMFATLVGDAAWAQAALVAAPWVFLVGALLFVVMQRLQTYDGQSLVIRRLRSIQFLSGMSFIVAGLLMVENVNHFLQPFVANSLDSYFTYVRAVHNNWVVFVLIGAVLQMYTAHRITAEIGKES